MKDFVDALDPVNAVADRAAGFIWRLRSETGNATDVPVFGDSWLIVNMSVWQDRDALTAFMYQGQHRELLVRRREWFERVAEAMTALWWVPAGERPTVQDAEERLRHLREHGPTERAFTLRTDFPAPAAAAADQPIGLRDSALTSAVSAAACSRSTLFGSWTAVLGVTRPTKAAVLPSPQAHMGMVLVTPASFDVTT